MEGIWFTIGIGRERQADPKWLLPLLCRRGDVTRAEIGKILIFPRETRFEIAAHAAAAFEAKARRPDPKMPGVRIEVAREAKARPVKRPPPVSRWLVAAGGVALMACLGTVYAWSVFTQPLQAAFGWTSAQATAPFSIAIFFLGVGAVAGRALAGPGRAAGWWR